MDEKFGTRNRNLGKMGRFRNTASKYTSKVTRRQKKNTVCTYFATFLTQMYPYCKLIMY
jgi:hypothetical protein